MVYIDVGEESGGLGHLPNFFSEVGVQFGKKKMDNYWCCGLGGGRHSIKEFL